MDSPSWTSAADATNATATPPKELTSDFSYLPKKCYVLWTAALAGGGASLTEARRIVIFPPQKGLLISRSHVPTRWLAAAYTLYAGHYDAERHG